MAWVQLEACARRSSLLEYQVVPACPLHEVAELQAGWAGADDDVLRLDHLRRRRSLLGELCREPRHQLGLPAFVGAQQGIDGVELLWLVPPEQFDQRKARLGRSPVGVGPSPCLVEQPVQVGHRQLRRQDQLLKLGRDVLAVQRRTILRGTHHHKNTSQDRTVETTHSPRTGGQTARTTGAPGRVGFGVASVAPSSALFSRLRFFPSTSNAPSPSSSTPKQTAASPSRITASPANRASQAGSGSIHRRVHNYSIINTDMRKNQRLPGGPRSMLHLSVGPMYSARIQPSL